jgi:DNA repair exonuclease SbcCD ATPase subunit
LRTGPVPVVPLGPAPSGGWMGLLQTHMEIANLEDNIVRLRDNLLRLEETLQEMLTTIPDTAEEIPRQRLQVAQARQALFGAESRLLSARAAFQQDLDLFKLELGLPPHICVRIDDPMLDQFQLIDPTAKERQDEIDRLRQRAGRINIDILTAAVDVEDPVTGFIERALDWSEALEVQLRGLQQEFAEVAGIIERLQTENVARVREDVEQLQETLPQRQQETARLQRLLEIIKAQNNESSQARIASINAELEALATSIEQWELRVMEANRKGAEYQRLSAAVERTRQFYERLLTTIRNLDVGRNVVAEGLLAHGLPALTLVETGKDRAAVGPEVEPHRLAFVTRHGLPKNGEVAGSLWQSIAHGLPGLAAVS